MDFCTGTTGSGLTHLPKVIFKVSREDTFRREIHFPGLFCFHIAWQPLGLASLKVRHVESIRGNIIDLGEQEPGSVDSLALEIRGVPEGPVSEHLEKGMVISVTADVLQVIVFATRSDAFLAVRRASEFSKLRVRVGGSQEDTFKLIHTSVSEEKCLVALWYYSRGGHKAMITLVNEIINERAACFLRGPFKF